MVEVFPNTRNNGLTTARDVFRRNHVDDVAYELCGGVVVRGPCPGAHGEQRGGESARGYWVSDRRGVPSISARLVLR